MKKSLNIMNGKSLTIILTIVITVVLSGLLIMLASQSNIMPSAPMIIPEREAEKLIYVSDDNQLISYNPQTRVGELILEDVRDFRYSPDRRIAYTKLSEKNVYIYDPKTPDIEPIQITQNSEFNHYIQGWSPDGQYLAFQSGIDHDNDLLYIWDGDTTIKITPDDGVGVPAQVTWSSDNKLAFSLINNITARIPSAFYVWDDYTTIKIMQNNTQLQSSLSSWSPDGQYLLITFYKGLSNPDSFYIWDGQRIIDITPSEELGLMDGIQTYWSNDGQLAIMIRYENVQLDTGERHSIPPEIYIWNGETTASLTQNPDGWDSVDIFWSDDGQLLFQSKRDDVINTFIWDGKSYRDGVPDTSSFKAVAPDSNLSYVVWKDSNHIAGIAYEYTQHRYKEQKLIIWDVETESIISENPISHTYARSNLSDDTQVVFSAAGSFDVWFNLDVQDMKRDLNFSILTVDYAWSSDGYLAYCGRDNDGYWTIQMTDGYDTWEVANSHGGKWQSHQWYKYPVLNGNGPFYCWSG